jgi:hypothetical protein
VDDDDDGGRECRIIPDVFGSLNAEEKWTGFLARSKSFSSSFHENRPDTLGASVVSTGMISCQ